MKLPIIAYGDPVLRKRALEITLDYPSLDEIIANMFETMYAASGVGLAAPQVGLSIRLFIIDAYPFMKEQKDLANFKKVFINPQIIEEEGGEWLFNEGCLSLPDIREDISRKRTVRIAYLDEFGKVYDETYQGIAARIIQHEYDHLEGKLFIDKLSPLRKMMLRAKLNSISKGLVNQGYKMRFYAQKAIIQSVNKKKKKR